VDVLNECYEVDEKKAQDLLVRELDHWGCVTCVLIAVETDNKQFISQTACQSLLNSVWMGKLSADNGTAKVMFTGALTGMAKLCLCMGVK